MRFLLALCVLALAFTGAAQDAPPETEPSAFLRILSAVPTGEYVENGNPLISFGAYHEAIAAAGLDIPQDWDDYRSGDPAAVDAAVYTLGPGALRTYDTYGERYAEIAGFDFFEVEYAAAFGVPPQSGIVLAGEFDTNAVIAAHSTRGYTVEALDGGTLLCPPDGCDTGKVTDPAAMDPANPFGGRLGRQEPVFVADGLILNSPDIAVLEAMIAAYEDSAESLADLPEYQALAAVLTDTVYHSLEVFGPGEFGLPGERSDEVEALLDSAPLPRYIIAASANGTGKDGLSSSIVLVYSETVAAESAAAAIDARADLPLVQHIMDTSVTISYREWFEMFGAALQPTQVLYNEAGGLTAVISRRTPIVASDPGQPGLYTPLAPLYEVSETE
jgi:hypothetical protein